MPHVARALTPISTDTIINDATYAGDGIDVFHDTTATIVQIQPGAQIGADSVPHPEFPGNFVDASVRVRDDCHVYLSGGTLDERIMLLDTSRVTVTGTPTLLGNGIDAVGTANTIDCSGATMDRDIDLRTGTPEFIMNGGSVLTHDFIDVDTEEPGHFSTVSVSNITTTERDFLDFYGRGSVTLTNVSTGPDAVQSRRSTDAAGSTVTWTGGSVVSEDGTPETYADALDIYWDIIADVDGVDITGRDAMDGYDTSVSTLSNLTITGLDAIDANNSCQITLNSVTIIGDNGVDSWADSTVILNDVHIDGADAMQANDTTEMTLKNVTLANPGTAAVDGHQLYSDETAIVTVFGLDFAIDGIPVAPGDVTALAGRLVVTNLDGTTFDGYFGRAATATIRLVPEPAAMSLLTIGAVALTVRRRKK